MYTLSMSIDRCHILLIYRSGTVRKQPCLPDIWWRCHWQQDHATTYYTGLVIPFFPMKQSQCSMTNIFLFFQKNVLNFLILCLDYVLKLISFAHLAKVFFRRATKAKLFQYYKEKLCVIFMKKKF